ncbi:MAG: hypothetical protein ACRD3M_17105 [Thermoanaerobaculia bacterium]
MSRAALLLLAAVLASPVAAYLAYRAARGLGFLDPPVGREQELKRAILAALYALLLLLPVFLFGWERRWPRVWIVFGVASGLALAFFALSGIVAARALWRLRQEQERGARGEGSGSEKDASELPAPP